MIDLNLILEHKFPPTEARIEGQLVYLKQYELTKIHVKYLEQKTRLDFYKAKFFTGYRKFTIIDIVIGTTIDGQLFLLTNPLFSDKYSSLITQFENISVKDVDQVLINEIVELYKIVGTNITEIDSSKHLYQIWFGNHKWRKMKFDKSETLSIRNYT